MLEGYDMSVIVQSRELGRFCTVHALLNSVPSPGRGPSDSLPPFLITVPCPPLGPSISLPPWLVTDPYPPLDPSISLPPWLITDPYPPLDPSYDLPPFPSRLLSTNRKSYNLLNRWYFICLLSKTQLYSHLLAY